MEAKKQTKRFIELEGLRGLAAIAVVLHHIMFMFYAPLNSGRLGSGHHPLPFESYIYGTPLALPFAGTFAVAIFFVLSGFVLSIGFFQTKNLKVVKKLASTRYLRLVLPAFVSVIIGYLLITTGLNNLSMQAATAAGAGSTYASALQFDANLIEAVNNGLIGLITSTERIQYNTVLWTMFIEFWGSFMVFGLLFFFGKSKKRWPIYGALGILTFNTWFLPFVIGTVIADLYANGLLNKLRNRKIVASLLIGAVALGAYPNGTIKGTMYEWLGGIQALAPNINNKMLFVTIAATMLMMAVLLSVRLSSLLQKVGWLGKYTYSLYLTHKFVIFTSISFIFLTALPLGYNKAALLSIVISIPVFIIVSVLYEKYVDAPSVRFAKKIASIRPDTKLLRSLLATQEPTTWKSDQATID